MVKILLFSPKNWAIDLCIDIFWCWSLGNCIRYAVYDISDLCNASIYIGKYIFIISKYLCSRNFLKKYIPINQNWTFLKSSKALKLLKIGPLWRIPLHYLKCENTIGIYWRMKLQFTRPKLNFFW